MSDKKGRNGRFVVYDGLCYGAVTNISIFDSAERALTTVEAQALPLAAIILITISKVFFLK
jgi:hypothetical protein